MLPRLGIPKVSDKPLMFVVDTPGILPLPDGMMHKHHSGRAAARGDDDGAAATKLALTGAVPDGRVTDDEQVRWLLRHLKQPYYKARMSQIVAHAAFADATSSRRERGRSGSEQRVAAAVAAAVIASDEQLLSAEPHRGGASEAVVESEEEGDSDDDGRPKPSGRAAAVASADTAAAAAARRRQQRSLTLDPTGTQLRLDHVMSLLRVDVDRGSGYDNALRRVLSCFRGGGLGRFTLDDVSEMRPAHDKQWFERD